LNKEKKLHTIKYVSFH